MKEPHLYFRYFDGSFQEHLNQMENIIFAYLRPQKNPLMGKLTLPELQELFSKDHFPETGFPLESLFQEIQNTIIPNCVREHEEKFLGHMTTKIPYPVFLIDFLISILNQNLVKIETAFSASFIERQALAWLHRLFYQRSHSFYKEYQFHIEHSLANATNGGTLGNLTALTVARNQKFPLAHHKGLYRAMKEQGYENIVIIASNRVQYSIMKAAGVLGIGVENVIGIPCEPFTNKISLLHLQKKLQELQKEKTYVLALIGIAGTTETGNCDPLEELGKIAQENNIWFHVDAAWGGPLIFSQRGQKLLQGISQADSIVIDGHKLLYLTMNHGAVIFKNPTSTQSIKHSSNYIIREGSVDIGRTSLEGSRRFDSFKLWFMMRLLGRQGYENLIDLSLENASKSEHMIQNHPSFETTSLLETNILTYRFIPEKWKIPLQDLYLKLKKEHSFNHETLGYFRKVHIFINQINKEIHKLQRKLGTSFVSRTKLETYLPPLETVVLRLVIFQVDFSEETFTAVLNEQQKIGNQVIEELWDDFSFRAQELEILQLPSLLS